MDNLQEIENAEGLYRIEKVKLYKEIVPLENSFIVKDESYIKVVKKMKELKGLCKDCYVEVLEHIGIKDVNL